MFDFERLKVFEKAVDLSAGLSQMVDGHEFHQNVGSQLLAASNQIVVEIAHGAARINIWEKKKRFANARSNAHECAAILILLHKDQQLPKEEYDRFYSNLTGLSIMLLKLVQNTQPRDKASTNGSKVTEQATA